MQAACLHACLFADFAGSTILKRLILIARAGGQFEKLLPGGMTVLPHEMDITVLIDRDEDDRPTVFDDLELRFTSIRCFQGIAPDFEGASLHQYFRFQQFKGHDGFLFLEVVSHYKTKARANYPGHVGSNFNLWNIQTLPNRQRGTEAESAVGAHD